MTYLKQEILFFKAWKGVGIFWCSESKAELKFLIKYGNFRGRSTYDYYYYYYYYYYYITFIFLLSLRGSVG